MSFPPRFLLFWTLTLIGFGCVTPAAPPEAPLTLVDQMEAAHHKEAFLAQQAIRFDLHLIYGGKDLFKGTITLSTHSDWALMETADSNQLFVNKEEVWYSPGISSERRARFEAYTWPYFFLLPYKLNDPGTKWTDTGKKSLVKKSYLTHRLEFESGTGDAPDDWYLLYADPANQLIEHAAYIVTAGRTREEAEKDPHSIEYRNYQPVAGIPIAYDWVFWTWREQEGLTQQLGEASLSNVEFIEMQAADFVVPTDFLLAE